MIAEAKLTIKVNAESAETVLQALSLVQRIAEMGPKPVNEANEVKVQAIFRDAVAFRKRLEGTTLQFLF